MTSMETPIITPQSKQINFSKEKNAKLIARSLCIQKTLRTVKYISHFERFQNKAIVIFCKKCFNKIFELLFIH